MITVALAVLILPQHLKFSNKIVFIVFYCSIILFMFSFMFSTLVAPALKGARQIIKCIKLIFFFLSFFIGLLNFTLIH